MSGKKFKEQRGGNKVRYLTQIDYWLGRVKEKDSEVDYNILVEIESKQHTYAEKRKMKRYE